MKLPIVETCDGCGACCMEQGSPPGYLLLLFPPSWVAAESEIYQDDDFERFQTLPTEALNSLRDYQQAIQAAP